MGRESVDVKIERTTVLNDNGRRVPGIVATCTRCEHKVSCYGQTERSEKRACVMLAQECPESPGEYFYVPDPDELNDSDAEVQTTTTDSGVVNRICRQDVNPPDDRELLVYRTYAEAAMQKRMLVKFDPEVILSLLNAISILKGGAGA